VADPASVLGLLILALLSRRLGYLFSHSFWLDEGWVADSVRAPLGQLRLLTSSTPIGWTLLLRLIPPVGPPERLRLLPIAFAVAAVIPAYLLGRRLGRVQAVAAGLAAAVAPSALANDDLKQYTADVLVTLLLLCLAAWVESAWSVRRLAVLCAVCVPAVLVSHATVFASAAVLGALALRCLAERRWERLRWVAALGLAVAVVEGAVYLTFLSVGDNAGMQRTGRRSSSRCPRGPAGRSPSSAPTSPAPSGARGSGPGRSPASWPSPAWPRSGAGACARPHWPCRSCWASWWWRASPTATRSWTSAPACSSPCWSPSAPGSGSARWWRSRSGGR